MKTNSNFAPTTRLTPSQRSPLRVSSASLAATLFLCVTGSSALAGVAPPAVPPEGLAIGLVNYWNFDSNVVDWAHTFPSASSVADDGTFGGANGIAGIGFAPGLFGDSIDQDGSAGASQNNGHIVVARSADTLFGANATNPGSPSTVTTSMWLQTAGFDSGWQTMLSHGEGAGYRIARRGNQPIAAYAGGSGDIPGGLLGPDISAGTGWHHVLAISEGGVSTRLWVDGGLVATGGAPNIDDNRAGGTLNLLIGANPDTGAQNREWWGQIDDVAQWNRALSEAEISQLWGGGPAGALSLGDLLTGIKPLAAGFDLFSTPAGSSHADLDFDGPGGLPPMRVEFEGNPEPLEELLGPVTTDTDTIVRRLDLATPEPGGQPATVDIELVALSLRSVDPVDIGGTLFDVEVIGGSLLVPIPSSPGQMQILRTGVTGGTYDATLPVIAIITFTEVGSPDPEIHLRGFSDILVVEGAPWSDLPGPGYPHSDDFPSGGFHPGVIINPASNCTEKVLTVEQSQLAAHGILPAMKSAKWVQLPAHMLGENIPSDIEWRTVPAQPPVAQPNWVLADDFRSDGRPIAGVHWWGSYFDPQDAPQRGADGKFRLSVEDTFVISFFSDIPATPAGGSRPGNLLGTYILPKEKVWVQPTAKIGGDGHPLWQYQVNLADAHLEHASPLATQRSFDEVEGDIYWISIVAANGHDLVEVHPNPVVLTEPADVYKLNGGTGGDPGGGEGAAPSRFFGTDGTDGIRGQIQDAIDSGTDPNLNQNSHPDTLIEEGETPNPAQNDQYRLSVRGEFIVDNGNGVPDETVDLTFTLRCDDGAQFRIFGQDFTGTAGDGRTFLEDIDGDAALTADFFTGNTNALGHIALVEGIYQFEGYMYEGGGGSRFELQAALGTHTGFNAEFFIIDDFIPSEPWAFVDNGDPVRTDHFWGWHTSPDHFNDIAVMGNLLMPGEDWVYTEWSEIQPQHNDLGDMAFKLYTRKPDVPPDETPPVINGAKDIVANAPAGGTARVSYANISATDEVDGPVRVTCSPPDTTAFPVGVTAVTCTATDSAGNTAMATFNVFVLEFQDSPSQRPFDSVSLRGDSVPGPAAGTVGGLPAGAQLHSFNNAYLNNSAEVAFQASLVGADLDNFAVFSNASGALASLGVKNNASPAGPDYLSFKNLAIADDGVSSFGASTTAGDSHVTDSGTSTTLLVGVPPPGLAGSPLVRSLSKPALDGAGDLFSKVALLLDSGAPAVTVRDDTLIWSAMTGQVAREGDQAADLAPGVDFGHLYGRVVANDGPQVAFAGNLTGAGGANSALWSGSPSALSVVAQRGDTAPGTDGAKFTSFLAESISPAGTVVFRAGLRLETGVVDSSNNQALFTNRSGSLAIVAREGDTAPCAPDGVQFGRFASLFIDDAGSIVFSAFLKGESVNSANDGSVWRSDPDGNLHLIAREGSPANNVDGGIFAQLEVVAVNNTGGALIQARLLPGIGDVTVANRRGIWRASDATDVTPQLVIRRGDLIDVGGTLHSVSALNIGYVTNAVGGAGGYGRVINDSGAIVTSLSLTNGISGVFTLP